ncbi:MAG: 4Fe-4S binding protein [Anaerolineae bacterium]|nr:4Fe-4S binding protein [Anaerolineae bacterium]
MKECVVLSGKGGTGKTSVLAALADLAARDHKLVLADADVDAANLELLVSPRLAERHDFVGGRVAEIDPDLCRGCELCLEVCRFGAILDGEGLRVDPVGCEGCASCFYSCPANAIEMRDRLSGQWFRSETDLGPLFHARLSPGQENSGKLVAQVKMAARLRAASEKADLLLVDGPPGIGCPAIAATSGAQLALLVAEPSVSGVHDLARILATTRHFGVPAVVCINKADINLTQTERIGEMCSREGVPLLGQIPFDPAMVETLVRLEPVTRAAGSPAAEAVRSLWEELRPRLV